MSRINKVLIANRGAIATRIIRTLDAMGIASVAVYAESDRDSLHVQRATERFSLGDGSASDTYLDMDKLLAIAAEAACQAIHPGYGFLSEVYLNHFVEAGPRSIYHPPRPTTLWAKSLSRDQKQISL